MVDPTEHEREAMLFASQQAGEFLDTLPSTDLAAMDEATWLALIEIVCSSFTDRLRDSEDARRDACAPGHD